MTQATRLPAEWSIQEVARLAGTTSRALRHYQDAGLLIPSRIGSNGYRYYDRHALVRLQRILMLRELGLGLAAIGEVLDGQRDSAAALRSHLGWLRVEKDRLDRQIASVSRTITTMEGGEPIMAEDMLDGFDHTQYKDEVEQRWGAQAYADSDRWYRGLDDAGKRQFFEEGRSIAQGYAAARAEGRDPVDQVVQAIAARHYAWVRAGWGGTAPSAAAFTGLGQMYAADERFGRYYGGPEGAAFARDAMAAFAASLPVD